MHISDIVTAMILKKLLESLFANQIYVVTSSNYHPDKLWPNGLMRERFLPAIEVIKDRLNIVSLNSQQDYRLINNSVNQLFILQDNTSRQKLTQIFASINLTNSVESDGEIEISNRQIPFIQQGIDVIWFDFAVICGDMRSQLDYLELVSRFKWFVISDIPHLTLEKKDIARRFTWLIDVLYDANCKLVISSIVSIREIYTQGDFVNEFERTVSRLEEMQTQEYLQKKLTAQ
jgi:cell division protein ZapE